MALALLDEFGIGDARERDESWRYSRTALRALQQQAFAEAAATDSLLADELSAKFDWPAPRRGRIVFANGSASPSDLTAGVIDGVLIEHSQTRSRILVPEGCTADLHLVFANVPSAQASRWRRDLSIEVSGTLRLTEQHIGVRGADVLGDIRTQLRIAPGGSVRAATLGDLPDSVSIYRRDEASVGAGARHDATHVLFGGRLQRFDIDVALAGDDACHASRGLFALRGRQHVDVHLDVRHGARDTTSDVLWRGVADQRARGILHGAITVQAGADGADARLQTKNLLLSAHAEIDAQPVLEIYADEVKASHGATVGRLDDQALFYLRTRGLPAAIARSVLIAGFCREVLTGIDDADLRARFEAILDERLPDATDVSTNP